MENVPNAIDMQNRINKQQEKIEALTAKVEYFKEEKNGNSDKFKLLSDAITILDNHLTESKEEIESQKLHIEKLKKSYGSIRDPGGKHWWPERVVGGNGNTPHVDGWTDTQHDICYEIASSMDKPGKNDV